MTAVVISLIGLALVATILVRGWRLKLLRRLPMFYLYMALHFSCALILWPIYLFSPAHYSTVFWPLDLITRMAEYGVLLAIIKHIFMQHTVILAITRVAAVGLLLVLFVSYVVPPIFKRTAFDPAMHSLVVRMAATQAIILLASLGVAWYQRIRLHHNLRLLCLGFGMIWASRVADFTLSVFVGRSYISTLRIADATVWAIIFAGWAIGLRQSDSLLQVDRLGKFDPSASAGQLRRLNARLMRLLR